MNSVRSILSLILALWLCGVSGLTQSISAELAEAPVAIDAPRFIHADGISLAAAVRYALAHNQELRAERKRIDEASAKRQQAALRANPMLDVLSGTSINDRSMNEVTVGVSLPLEYGGRRARRIDLAERELELMRYEVAERERQLAAEVRAKYGEALEAARNLELNERLYELNQRSYTLVRARVDAGASAPLEQRLLGVEVAQRKTQCTALNGRVLVLLAELKNLLGWDDTAPLKLQDEFIVLPLTLTRAQALAQALQTRPDLQAARALEAVAAALLAQAETEGKLDLSLFTEFSRQSWRFDQLGMSHETGLPERVQMRNYVLKGGVSITLPVRNRNQGNIGAAVAARAAARLRRAFVESVVRRDVTTAFTRWEQAQQVLVTYNTELLAAAQDNLRVVRASYELGHLRLTDVLNEQRRLIEVQMGYTAALKESFTARAELESAIGGRYESFR